MNRHFSVTYLLKLVHVKKIIENYSVLVCKLAVIIQKRSHFLGHFVILYYGRHSVLEAQNSYALIRRCLADDLSA